MKHASLFSGIGGFDLSAEWMGWENVFHCEINPFGQRHLKYYWPNSISYADIKKTDFTIHRGNIDILTGGFPCQPYSQAGKRLGTEDDRHLWPEMLRAIREIQPRYVVGENVRGLTNWNGGLVFDQVQADLEAEGYEVTPFLLPACAVNAPHRRDRIWFIAHAINGGYRANGGANGETDSIQGEHRKKIHSWLPDRANATHGAIANPESGRSGRLRNESEAAGARQSNELSGGEYRISDNEQFNSDTCDKGLQGSEVNRGIGKIREIRKQQSFRSLPSTWQNFPTQSPVCGGDDGLPAKLVGITVSKHRNESIKAYGNAVVPQVVLQIFKAIEQIDNL